MHVANVLAPLSIRLCRLQSASVSHRCPMSHVENMRSSSCVKRSARHSCASHIVMASSQEVSPEEQGQISSELMQQMKHSITTSLEADKVEVIDVYGDGRHVSIEVVSKLFEGQSSVKRQRLVYKVSSRGPTG